MAEQPIQIEVTFDGASEATRELGRVSQGISNVGQTADRAGVTVESFSRGFQNTAQRIQGVAGAVQSLASALGSTDRTGSLIASAAGTTAQFAAMGAMFGPGGAIVGGIVGLTTSILSLARANDDAAESARRARDMMRELADQRIADRNEAARAENISAGNLAGISEEDLEREREMRLIRRGELRSEFNELLERGRRTRDMYEGAGREVPEAIARPILTRIREINAEFRALGEEAVTITGELSERAGGLGGAPETPTAPARRGGGGGGRRRERERDVFEMLGGAASNEDIASIGAEFERLAAERAEREAEANALIEEKRNAHYEALKEMAIEAQDAELERQREVNEALAEMENERQERIREGQLAMKENQEADEERSLERRRSLNGELMGLLGDATMAFGKSLAAIATGEQTAEEAFQGLAKAFLEMISQYATLKAATEFADAAASFAKYDYAGGAAHIGAGVAFTAIAVATGVGAAALGSAPSAPARPEAGGGTEAAQGGDVVINWNSPVITAGTQAELGRELQAAVSAAGSI